MTTTARCSVWRIPPDTRHQEYGTISDRPRRVAFGARRGTARTLCGDPRPAAVTTGGSEAWHSGVKRSRARPTNDGVATKTAGDLAGEIVRRGNDVYAHGSDHVLHDALTLGEIAHSLEQTKALLRARRPTPAPYLVRLHGAGHKQLSVHRAVQAWNHRSQVADWSASSEDWKIGTRCGTAFAARTASPSCGRREGIAQGR
jgi:hypothetical protein